MIKAKFTSLESPKATYTLLRFLPFLLMKSLPVHITPFPNRYAMKTKGVHIAPAILLLISVKKGPIATLNSIVINSLLAKECEAFSNALVVGIYTENGSFRNAFPLVFSKSSVFISEQCERRAKTKKFYSAFIRKRSSVNGA